jgi:alkylation response protein AidB-like acyl-CoA dehydrogenase
LVGDATGQWSGVVTDLVQAARDAGELIEAHADKAERDRRLPKKVIDALRDAQLLRMCVPTAYGGPEADPVTMAKAIEAVAVADGAAGWITMIASTTSSLSVFLPSDWADKIYGDRRVITAGVFAPNGTATAADDGWLVDGRWQWGSGVHHCQWVVGGVIAEDGRQQVMIFESADVTIHDTWHTSGLRGTASNDFSVCQAVVPSGRAITLGVSQGDVEFPLATFPNFTLLAIGVAAVALGIARRAIDEFVEVAGEKRPQFGQRTIAQMGVPQADLAKAEAAVRSARAFLFDEVEQAWQTASSGDTVDLASRARMRLAGVNAAEAAARAVDSVYTMSGGTSIFESSQLQRCLRDVHVATQHIAVAPRLYETLGKTFLGAEINSTML